LSVARLGSDLQRLDLTRRAVKGVQLNSQPPHCEPSGLAAPTRTVNHVHGRHERAGRYDDDELAESIEPHRIDSDAGESEQRVGNGDGPISIRKAALKERFHGANRGKRPPRPRDE